jgi:hypothetical protein
MGSASRARRAVVALAAVAALALIAIPAAIAAFSASTQSEKDIVTAAADFTPPAITSTVVGKGIGGVVGYVRKGGGYFVYANVSADTGNPASGIAAVKANVAEVTGGQTEVALTAGTWSAGGVTYNYRSAELTASATVEGSKTYSVTATDNAGNAKTVNGTVIVDNLIPTASDVQTTNVSGGVNGLAEQGDTIVFTFSEPVDPQSILAGWNGSATGVVVRIVDNGVLGLSTGNDELFVYNAANTAALPFGAVNLGRGDYVAGLLGGTITYGATTTASSMVMSGNTVTITLGTYTGGGIVYGRTTAAGVGTMVWTPPTSPTIYDRAGNVQSGAAATESGAADKDF